MSQSAVPISPIDAAIGWIAQRERVVRHALRLRGEVNRLERAIAQGSKPILVFTPQKTGSTAATRALERQPGLVISKVHTLVPAHDWDGNLHCHVHDDGTIKSGSHYSDAARRVLVNSNRPMQVVVTLREPVGANLSAFVFLSHRIWLRDKRRSLARLSGNELVQLFLNRFAHQSILVWPRVELEAALGISVMSRPFPHAQGWLRIQEGRWDVVILRSDLHDDTKSKVLREFTGVPAVTVTRERESGEGAGGIYGRLKAAIHAHPDYIKRMLRTDYARHFWSADELATIEARWLERR